MIREMEDLRRKVEVRKKEFKMKGFFFQKQRPKQTQHKIKYKQLICIKIWKIAEKIMFLSKSFF